MTDATLPRSLARSRSLETAANWTLLGLITGMLGLRLYLLTITNVNWDEFFFLSKVHDYLRGDLTKPPLGSLVYMPIEVLGEERITVAAGTFDTMKYQMAGRSNIWVTMPDRLVVRMENTGRGFIYELTNLERGDNS